jgi:outer membrane protein OmpA-like peptidoglycan-associated protein
MLNKFVFTTAFLTFSAILLAQNPTDLGSTKPFMVGLKGTIYKYTPPTKMHVAAKIPYYKIIEKTPPIGYVYTQSLNISERNLSESFPGVPQGVTEFAIIYKGKFDVKQDANYEFMLKSDDGSRLWIDTTEVISHDGLHQFNIPKKGSIQLKKGFHDIKVWYFQGLATRMGLLLLMKTEAEKDWLPFDLKPFEDDMKQLINMDNGLAELQLNEKLLFDIGKFVLKLGAENQLEKVAKLLIINPLLRIKIEGHTDNKGSAAANQLLSENRAKAVAEALKKMGIPETVVIETQGYGFSQPLVPNSTDENRAKNRRVNILISTN